MAIPYRVYIRVTQLFCLPVGRRGFAHQMQTAVSTLNCNQKNAVFGHHWDRISTRTRKCCCFTWLTQSRSPPERQGLNDCGGRVCTVLQGQRPSRRKPQLQAVPWQRGCELSSRSHVQKWVGLPRWGGEEPRSRLYLVMGWGQHSRSRGESENFELWERRPRGRRVHGAQQQKKEGGGGRRERTTRTEKHMV
ncbi:hypothetical protein SKAU_G00054410 [Synaphobranchus kaupii]|uniref:Uncharacterized protein n=1 Tax=Synaphobranchus kaupii TaxID=118154 RepID=A0A9Q1G444_SYNKA|nr:hypothetical protein SKAU_G00054410 [Synaphobranchus kaupii]